MAPNRTTESGFERVGKAREFGPLLARELILGRIFSRGEVAQHRSDADAGERADGVSHRAAFVRFKSQSVHSRIHLDVHEHLTQRVGVPRVRIGKGPQPFPTKNFRFKSVAQHQVKRGFARVEHHDGRSDPRLAQFTALFRVGHTEVVQAVALQGAGHRNRPKPVRVRLEHGHDSGSLRKHRAVVPQVGLHRVHVKFHHAVVLARQAGLKGRLNSVSFEQYGSAFADSRGGILGRTHPQFNVRKLCGPSLQGARPPCGILIKDDRRLLGRGFLSQDFEGFRGRGFVERVAVDEQRAAAPAGGAPFKPQRSARAAVKVVRGAAQGVGGRQRERRV